MILMKSLINYQNYVFPSAAALTFGVKSKYGKHKNNNKPWFTKECNKICKEFNKASDVSKKVKMKYSTYARCRYLVWIRGVIRTISGTAAECNEIGIHFGY
jgi:hypothetical protein